MCVNGRLLGTRTTHSDSESNSTSYSLGIHPSPFDGLKALHVSLHYLKGDINSFYPSLLILTYHSLFEFSLGLGIKPAENARLLTAFVSSLAVIFPGSN